MSPCESSFSSLIFLNRSPMIISAPLPAFEPAVSFPQPWFSLLAGGPVLGYPAATSWFARDRQPPHPGPEQSQQAFESFLQPPLAIGFALQAVPLRFAFARQPARRSLESSYR